MRVLQSVYAWVKPGVPGSSGDGPRSLLESGQPAPGPILHVALQSSARTDAGNRRRLEHEDKRLTQFTHLLAQIREDAVLGQSLMLALLERLEADEDDARVGRVGEGRAVEADERHGRFDARAGEQNIAGLAHDLVGAAECRARRQLEDGNEIGAVELGNEPRRRGDQPPIGEAEQASVDDQEHRPEPHEARGRGAVGARQALEHPIEAGKEPADRRRKRGQNAFLFASVLVVRLQQKRGERGRECQRHERGDRRRSGNRDGELAVERAL